MIPVVRNSLYAALVVLVGFLAASTYVFYQKAADLEKQTPAAQADEVTKLVQEVGRLMVLPEGEIPTVATVSSAEKLKDQPFFANAKTGDKVLIYQQAKKAILYDPTANKIVEISPINAPAASQPTTNNQQPTTASAGGATGTAGGR